MKIICRVGPKFIISPGFLAKLAAAVALGLLASYSTATMPIYPAQILDSGGTPCFTTPQSAYSGKPEFVSVVVYEAEGSVVWRQRGITAEPFVFSPSRCLHYGTQLEEEEKGMHATPHALKLFAVYAVMVSANLRVGEHLENRRYVGRFCLTPKGSGVVHVQTVPFDDKANKWDEATCYQ